MPPETFSYPEGRIAGHGTIVAGRMVDRKVVCKTAELLKLGHSTEVGVRLVRCHTEYEPDMQRRIVDRVEPKTLFPFGAPGEGPRACGTIRWASPVIDTGSRFWFSPHSVG